MGFANGFVSRRELLLGSAGLAVVGSTIFSTLAVADSPEQLAADAFIWGYPLVSMGRFLSLARKADAPFNRFVVTPTLATPALHAAGPNIDTLYGYGWLDLTKGPLVLQVPDTHDRYYSIQLIDAYQNSFDYVGRRQTGTKAGTYVLTPPGWSGALPAGSTEIKAPTTLVLALTRTLVLGDKDVAEADKVQAQYLLGPLDGYPGSLQAPIVKENALNVLPIISLADSGAGFFDELGALLVSYPPTPDDAKKLAAFAPIGVGPGLSPSKDQRFAKTLADGVSAGLARIQATKLSTDVNGWTVDYHVTSHITDPLTRAAVAQLGPGTHINREALYFGAQKGPDGAPLSGKAAYKLVFPKGTLPPVDGFWSLILYGSDYFLVDNSLNRYGINDRTEGLAYAPDGSLTLYIQHAPPAAGTSNWLPAPEGPFRLVFRTYQPRPVVSEGTYKLPPLQLQTA